MPPRPYHDAARTEGGVRHGCNEQCGEAAFLYIPHSAVVSRSETALPLRTREKGGDVSDPPKNRGVMRSRTDGICGMPLYRPPWGRSRPHLSLREGLEKPPFPSRFIVSDRSSPSRVRFAASRPGRLRADPKDALLTKGKGGIGPWGARASG